ncbi:putative triose-phosphate isomerase [Microsporum ferrugineum]
MADPATSGVTYPALPKTLLIISLKMYFTPKRTLEYLRALLDPQNEIVCERNRSNLLLALVPDFLTIYPCSEVIREFETKLNAHSIEPDSGSSLPPPFLLGAQDCFWEASGPYTGEISPSCLRSMDVSIVELGHAERRAIFRETDEQVGRKAAAVSAQGMVPLVCVGEIPVPGPVMSEAVGVAVKECEVQVRAVLDAIPADAPCIFAYEPVWAIGKPVPAGVDHIAAVVQGIRTVIDKVRGKSRGEVRVIYGGSAGPGLWGQGGLGKAVDGMFLGRFAHEIEGVKKVVREVEESL